MNFTVFKRISIKEHSELGEKFIQDKIAEDPSIIGLGDLILKDKERNQPTAGRLDLLFQDSETNRRYEVEIQLGRTDEGHIIRTLEYWDIERKRYPQYDHCAVIIAEDITSRFLNVIQLFNGNIPMIAIQINAWEVDGKIGLTFTKVLDELKIGLNDEDKEVYEPTDRGYWENRGSIETVKLADDVLGIIKEIDNSFEIKYNKYYIGLIKNGHAQNFIVFRARRNNLKTEIKLERSDDIDNLLKESGLEWEYNNRNDRYYITIVKDDIPKNREVIKEVLRWSYNDWNM